MELKWWRPSSTKPMCLQAPRTAIKVISLGNIPLSFISENMSSDLLAKPFNAKPRMRAFQVETPLSSIS
uniref:Uncharacterized protein n=1 Tax=Rhizophora mucronata TaxID=61149 RepID=A0A2P2NKI8_RHIMU